MPKVKSHRGAMKRFKRNANGRIKVRRAYRNHILTKKTTKLKRSLRAAGLFLNKCDQKLAERMMEGC